MAAAKTLFDVAVSVADGTPLDWDDICSRASIEEREILEGLRGVSVLSGIHRTLVEDEPGSPSRGMTPRPADGVQLELGSFLLMTQLGTGSQGEVYRAFDTRLERDVALKLRPLPKDGDLAQVLREGRLLAKVRHRHIVTVYGIEVLGESVALSMELIVGQTLDTIVRRRGTFSPDHAAAIGCDLSDAVEAVHAAGLIHRDIKAQNVVLEDGGRVVLMDFGTGTHQRDAISGSQAGTPLYLAPELLMGGAASVRSDIYSMGVLLYYLLTGRFPYDARTVGELREQINNSTATTIRMVRREVPADLADIVQRCLNKDPSQRYASARALGDALRAATAASTRPKASRLRTGLFVAVPALLIAALVGTLNVGTSTAVTSSPVLGVQPFRDLSGDETVTRLADGLSESLTAQLGGIPSLRVINSRAVRDADRSGRLPELVQQAGVTALLGGTIELTPTQARINVRLVDAISQTQLWEVWLQRDRAQLLDLQNDITAHIVSRFRINLTAEHRRRLQSRTDVSGDAVDAYLRGWAEFYRLTRSGHEEAERLFRRATELAPNFAPARSAHAYSTFILGSSYRVIPPPQAYADALAEAHQALALDPSWGHAHGILGLLAFSVEWNWAEAEKHFLTAIEANPSDANVRGLYAQMLMLQNRLGAALNEARIAQKLEPLNPSRRNAISVVLYYARRYQEAIAEMEELQRSDPNSSVAHFGLARYYSAVGRFDDALIQLETAPYKDEAPPKAEYARILAAAGRTQEALDRLPMLIERYRNGDLAPDYLAYVYVALGDSPEALRLLKEAVDVRSPSVVWAHVDPRFDALRLHPEFRSLMNHLGFAQ